MVGATGVEPARIAPKDPKSFASANSATRPNRWGIFAAAETVVNTFQAAMLARQQWAILTASVGGELLRLVPRPPNRGGLGHMEIHAPIRTAQRVDRVIERLLPIDAVAQTAQPMELVQLPFPTPDPGGSHLHHERHFILRLRFQTHVLAGVSERRREPAQDCHVQPEPHHSHGPQLVAQITPTRFKEKAVLVQHPTMEEN